MGGGKQTGKRRPDLYVDSRIGSALRNVIFVHIRIEQFF